MRFDSLHDVAQLLRTRPEDPRTWSQRSHFLDRDTMRFFDSRMSHPLHVVTSTPTEFHAFGVVSNRYRDPWDPAQDGPRTYRVVDVRITVQGGRYSADVDYADGYEHRTPAQAHLSARSWRAVHDPNTRKVIA